jgi:hypothetical protein
LPGAEGFKKFVRDVATGNRYFEYEKIVIVSDGATWIRAMCDELFPGSQQIPGYYHLAENIYSFKKYIFSNDEKKYTPRAESLPCLLKNGRTEEAIESPRGQSMLTLRAKWESGRRDSDVRLPLLKAA